MRHIKTLVNITRRREYIHPQKTIVRGKEMVVILTSLGIIGIIASTFIYSSIGDCILIVGTICLITSLVLEVLSGNSTLNREGTPPENDCKE